MLETRFFFVDEFTEFHDYMTEYPHERKSFPKGSALKKTDEEFTENYYIESGLVKVSVLHESGRERVIGFWGKGSMFPIVTSRQKFTLEYSIIATAVTEVVVSAFDINSTRNFMGDHPDISYAMIDHYCKYTNLFLYSATTEAFDSLKMRICSILMIYYLNFGTTTIPVNQSDIASLLGANRQSVVKILKQLRDDGLVDTIKGKLSITDTEKLSAITTAFL